MAARVVFLLLAVCAVSARYVAPQETAEAAHKAVNSLLSNVRVKKDESAEHAYAVHKAIDDLLAHAQQVQTGAAMSAYGDGEFGDPDANAMVISSNRALDKVAAIHNKIHEIALDLDHIANEKVASPVVIDTLANNLAEIDSDK